jgi:gas vesicle protein
MKNHVIGFCIGAGAGVAVGLLCAPRSGEATRSLIQHRAESGLRDVKRDVKRRRIAFQRMVLRAKRNGARMMNGHGDAVKAALAAGKQAFVRATG